MSNESKNKNKAMAAYLKEKGITRTTGTCPMSCGAQIANGGAALLSHLTRCGRKN